MFDQPVQLSLMSRAFDTLRDDERLVGLWLGGERWLRVKDQLVSAFVFFHLQEGGAASISIRTEDSRLPSRVHGRWWLEGAELVVALGDGQIRGLYHLEDGVLSWADEVLVRKTVSSRTPEPPPPPTCVTNPFGCISSSTERRRPCGITSVGRC